MTNFHIHRMIQHVAATGEDPVSVVQSSYILLYNVHYHRETIRRKVAEVMEMAEKWPELFEMKGD